MVKRLNLAGADSASEYSSKASCWQFETGPYARWRAGPESAVDCGHGAPIRVRARASGPSPLVLFAAARARVALGTRRQGATTWRTLASARAARFRFRARTGSAPKAASTLKRRPLSAPPERAPSAPARPPDSRARRRVGPERRCSFFSPPPALAVLTKALSNASVRRCILTERSGHESE